MENIWDYVVDGLFAVFLVSIIAGIAASSTSFSALLTGMFGNTAHAQILAINASLGGISWIGNATGSIAKGAEVLYKTSDASSQVYPLATYVTIFALFIGAVLGIVVYSMRLITRARVVPVPVRAA